MVQRVMLTDNSSVSDRLITGSIDTVKHLDRRSKPFCSTIYVKFNDPKAGNSMKDIGFVVSRRNLYQLSLEQRGFL